MKRFVVGALIADVLDLEVTISSERLQIQVDGVTINDVSRDRGLHIIRVSVVVGIVEHVGGAMTW